MGCWRGRVLLLALRKFIRQGIAVMKKEYKFLAIGVIVILAGAFFLMKDSFLFPWEKEWRTEYFRQEFKANGSNEIPVAVLDWGYRFVSVESYPQRKEITWVWKITVQNLSKKDAGDVRVNFKLTDSNRVALAEDGETYLRAKSFYLRPNETATFSNIVRSPIYAKQAKGFTWAIWHMKQ
jgi:uncharacterized protein affecting Mg2+/Co2+ transport